MMSSLMVLDELPATSGDSLRLTREFESHQLQAGEQLDLETLNVLHAGVYARTIKIPAGVVITGALIKIPTVLLIHGSMKLTAGDKCISVDGFACFKCPAGRKQIMVAKTDCFVTMIFATKAKKVREAEDEFTDEGDLLLSRKEKKR